MSKVDLLLTQHLVLWKDEGIPAPKNELQSIASWLSVLGQNTKEETMTRMRLRMLLLQKAAMALHEEGQEAEREAGIYTNRPDLIPKENSNADGQERADEAQ